MGLSLVVLAGDEVLRGIVSVGSFIGIGGRGAFYGLMLVGFLLVWPVGWLLLRLITRLYERKQISDQSISQNKGCVFEVEELINVAPLGRVVFIVDHTTDEHFLLENVRQSWARMKPTSPNRSSRSGQVQFFRFTGSRSGELRQLLRALCIAANPA